jgi:hypothetical protein
MLWQQATVYKTWTIWTKASPVMMLSFAGMAKFQRDLVRDRTIKS